MDGEKKTNLLSIFLLSMKISFSASNAFSVIRIICCIINAVLPTVKLLLMKFLIDALMEKMREDTLICLVLFLISHLLGIAVDKINNYCIRMHNEKISMLVSKKIIDKVNNLDISYFDTPSLYDEMSIATQNGGAISNLFWSLISLIQGFVQLAISALIIIKINKFFAIVLIISCLPYFFVERDNEIEIYLWNRENENSVRKINYLYRVLVDKYFCIDLRINNMLSYLKEKYNCQWNDWFCRKKQMVKRQFIKSYLSLMLSNIVALSFVLLLVYSVLFNDATISDFTYYLGVSTQLVNYTYFVLNGFSSFKQIRMKTDSYNRFMNWKPLLSENGEEEINERFKNIKFENVSFSYPNCTEKVLDNISFEIVAGEKVLLIGNNGSGKSSIVKLILRLYEPTEGVIYLNDKPLNKYSKDSYYRVFSSLLQNHVNYAFSMRENILGKNDIGKTERVMKCIEKADLIDAVARLPNSIDTFLTKQFDIEGVELSVGEWQKMALARFFCKDAEFLILDEPTSSLDVFAQDRTLPLILNSSKTVLMISHRLINLNQVTRVISISNGHIVEDGNPEMLEKEMSFFYMWKNSNMHCND